MTKIPLNPRLPTRFDGTPNESRPKSHQRWQNRPYIETYTFEELSARMTKPEEIAAFRQRWFEAWPSGTRYDVRCLDGGCHDRPTCWRIFKTLNEAIACAGG